MQTGFIEVCKSTYDEFVHGSFDFTITDRLPVSAIQQSVLVGQCTAPIEVAAGNATVTEAAVFPTYVDEHRRLPVGSEGQLEPEQPHRHGDGRQG